MVICEDKHPYCSFIWYRDFSKGSLARGLVSVWDIASLFLCYFTLPLKIGTLLIILGDTSSILSKRNLRLYLAHKAPTFARSRRGYGRQFYPQFIGEADSRTQTHNLVLVLVLLVEGTCHHKPNLYFLKFCT